MRAERRGQEVVLAYASDQYGEDTFIKLSIDEAKRLYNDLEKALCWCCASNCITKGSR